MSDNALTARHDISAAARPRAFDTIVYGGLLIALLDGIFAFVFYGLILGVPTLRIFQSVASGLLGRAAFDGGVRTFILGILLHILVATCIAEVYYLLSSRTPLLIRQAVICGLLYGLIAYLVMYYVVIPLSAVPPRRFSWLSFLPAFIAHAFLVGLPVALVARWSAGKGRK